MRTVVGGADWCLLVELYLQEERVACRLGSTHPAGPSPGHDGSCTQEARATRYHVGAGESSGRLDA